MLSIQFFNEQNQHTVYLAIAPTMFICQFIFLYLYNYKQLKHNTTLVSSQLNIDIFTYKHTVKKDLG